MAEQEQKDQRAPDGAALDVTEVLKEARSRIARGWCQGFFALGRDGRWIGFRDPLAVAWCADGAIWLVEHEDGRPYHFLRQAIGKASIHSWNDAEGRTQAEVLAAFDVAIALSAASATEGRPPGIPPPSRGTP